MSETQVGGKTSLKIKKYLGIQVFEDKNLVDQVLDLDRLNMEEILKSSGYEFPLEKRLATLKNETTVFFGVD